MNPNQQIIEEFYAGFAAHNPETMVSCYHPEIRFNDPAFGTLEGKDAADMWHMLIEKSKGNIEIEFSDVRANENSGSAKWIATYLFSKTGRKVINEVSSEFQFKDGLIVRHSDSFNIWKWSGQAFGLSGTLLGWTGFFQNQIRKKAIQSLRIYQNK